MRGKLAAIGVTAAVLLACAPDKPVPTAAFEIRTPLYAMSGGQGDFNLGTHLTGDEEVLAVPAGAPTPADSRAQGEAIFRVNAEGTQVDFRVIASNIDNVIMSHIHCGPAGVNGPIRMWLYPVIGATGAPGPNATGPQNGVLASGTFSPTGIVCPASAVGRDMPLLEAMREGLTYVNVHTKSHDSPPGTNTNNTGPGDFPGGEIRGQLDHGR